MDGWMDGWEGLDGRGAATGSATGGSAGAAVRGRGRGTSASERAPSPLPCLSRPAGGQRGARSQEQSPSKGSPNTGTGCPVRAVCPPRRHLKPPGPLWAFCSGWPCLSWRLDQVTSRGPFRPPVPCDPVKSRRASPGKSRTEDSPSPFSPGPSCKLSNQYIIQDPHGCSFQEIDACRRSTEYYQLRCFYYIGSTERNWALLENDHPLSGQSNYPNTKREQPLSVSHQKFTSRTLRLAPAARKAIPNTALCSLSHTPVHSPSAHRSSASPLLQPHMLLGSQQEEGISKLCS
ncbi:uncharacterized protein LOC119699127 [Motacilla alba alba]|uniref:uncharacterized protein LOC119699127 n=1 Tax=Motacilla alba alba TaxID=1094192 RepID=UPI0018D562E3|nr:uncharacterized protein LOC119699127 [Motacilla alba alba]